MKPNKSRFVTKWRNTIERVFGRLKEKYKFFSNSIDSNYIPILHRLLRIFGSLENKFGSILTKDSDDFPLEYFRNQLNKENPLKQYLENEKWKKISFERN